MVIKFLNRFRATVALFVLLATGCTAVQNSNGEPSDEVLFAAGQQVSRCNFKSHLQCIYLTGAETIADGRQAKWTRHWFRMSYIGRACEKQYGKTTGVVLETLFAIPHYLGIGIGNTLSVLLYLLQRSGTEDTPATESAEQSAAEPREAPNTTSNPKDVT